MTEIAAATVLNESFWIGAIFCLLAIGVITVCVDSIDWLLIGLYVVFLGPFVILWELAKICYDPVARMAARNEYMQWRIRSVDKAGAKRDKRIADRERLEKEYAELQQKMVEVCYKHPHVWAEREGKK